MLNIYDFAKQYGKEYDFLYDNDDHVAGYREAVEDFDRMMKGNDAFNKFVCEYVNFRGDFISSDREAAAFMFACEAMGLWA